MDTLGMTNAAWLRVLAGQGFDVDPIYWPRLLAAQLVAAASSLASALRPAPAPVDPDALEVLFIVGHWRSGTTYLHQLLSADRSRFSTLSTAMANFPHLHGTPLLEPVLRALALDQPHRRLFDNVIIDPEAPMELEYALMNSIGGSEYLCWTFPRTRFGLLDYLRDQPERLDPAHNAAWRRAVLEFCARLHQPGKIVLHKNPPSTACVAELAQLLPRARFVFLARSPADVYHSTLKTMRALDEVGRLQVGGDEELEAYVIERYARVHRAYLAQRGAIPQARLVEARFEELERDPLALVRRIHAHFGWALDDEGPYRGHLEGTAGYRKNVHAGLDASTRAALQRAWGDVLAQLGLEL